jgi:prepilin-type N-terminal cleavage/methylation domain-containing protein/prepilin-type processing-associated H-X9-DG protein
MNNGVVRDGRAGFSLLELLVVILILGILAALLMPAIHSVREASRRLHCMSNLRQIGIAITAYEMLHRAYPPPNVQYPQQHNLLTFLLPHLDQQSIHDRYHWDQSWDTAVNAVATQVDIPTFQCPSTPHDTRFGTDFAACLNIVSPARRTLLSAGLVRERSSWVSMLQPSRTTSAMVADGLANSFMLFEDAGRPAKYVARTRRSGSTRGAGWADANSSFEVHSLCRNGSLINCRNDNEIYSFHTNGCNFLYGDGSVHFIVQDMDPETFVSLFTRQAGDVAGAKWP